jgi:hypothetical protein
VKPILERSCYACHNSALKNADLNLQAYETEADVLKDDHTWSKVVQKVRTRVMPAPPFPPLSDDEVSLVTGWIEAAFERAEAAAPPDPGRVTARRLNRTEYDNSVRDLLGVDLHLAEDFPQDDTGYGFDNNGDVLSLSPALFEKYLIAADRIARAAISGPEAKAPGLVRVSSTRARVEATPDVLQEYDKSGLTLRNAVPRQAPLPGHRDLRRAPDPRRRAARGLRAARGRASSSTTSRWASSAWIPRASARSRSTARTSRARRASSACR